MNPYIVIDDHGYDGNSKYIKQLNTNNLILFVFKQ